MTARSLEDDTPELTLELPDTGTDCRLCQAQPPRACGEVSLVGYGDSAPELLQIH